MKTIMFGAQTAKQYQSNGQKYQDEMKDNPKLGVKRKTQKSVKHKIEEDKVIEAYITHWQEVVTHWQEIEKLIRVKQWQEQDHNFRHGAGEIEE
jgi:hypothetical protein